MAYINRELEKEILDQVRTYPVITITGPRQSGKTTMVRKVFNYLPYFSLESPDTRMLAMNDPRAFLNASPDGAVLDEVHRVPELLSYIQEIVDEDREKKRFILTGSNQFTLMQSITQSLAGRTAVMKLLPFSFPELAAQLHTISADDLLLRGFYPGIWAHHLDPVKAYGNYYETYLEKDLRQLTTIKDLGLFQRFVRLCAGRIGNILNASQLANETGISVPTVKSWLSLMESSFIIFLLSPFYENISKRLIRSPKIYFYDTGLACYLLGIENTRQLSRDPLRGALFENMVVSELLKERYNKGLHPNMFFFRDSHHHEVDVLIPHGSNLIAIEIKSSQTFHPDFLKGLNQVSKMIGERIVRKALVYNGHHEQLSGEIMFLNFRNIRKVLKEV